MVINRELSRAVDLEPWPDAGITVDLAATPDERVALAERFGLLELQAFTAEGRLERVVGAPDEMRLRLHLAARVVQSCVVTLEPVPGAIDETVERRFRRVTAGAADTSDELAEDSELAEVEPLESARLDVGEIAAEELGLALDPYPRAADADAALAAAGQNANVSINAAEQGDGPFAALAAMPTKPAG